MSSKVLEPPTPKAGKETVYVDVEDEITTIIDKVEAAKAKIVALVLPKRAATLQSVVNMRLLKRSAERASKTIVLITSDGALLPLAGAAGIYVAKTLQSKPEVPPSPLAANETTEPTQTLSVSDAGDEPGDLDDSSGKIDYNRSIGELAAAHEIDEPEVIALGDDEELPEPTTPKSSASKSAKSQKLKVPNFERFRLLLFGGIALLIALIVFIFLAIAVLPKASVAITTTSSPISANLTLNASDKYTTLNETANQIPASLKASNQTSQQTVNATGQQNQGNKASGSVTLTNCSTDNSDITVPAGTGLSSGGLTFITQKSVDLPFSGHRPSGSCQSSSGVTSGTVTVVAQSGGAKYNIGASNFTVAGFSDVTATSSSAFTGGTDNNVTVVSQADVDGARSKVTSQSTDDYTNKFISQLESSGFYVLRSTLKVGDPQVSANPAVGQQASSTSVSIQITYSVLVVQKSDLQKVISDNLNNQIDKSRQKISSSDVVKDASITVQNQTAPAAVTLNVSEGTTAIPIINTTQVKQLAAGKKSGDIKNAILTWPGVKDVNVKMSPFWVSKAPKNQNKITVTLNQVKQ
jgi:hypothetical protein